MAQLPYTLCWHCSASFPMEGPKCPKCGMTNANSDLETALTEMTQVVQDARREYDNQRAGSN